MSLSHEITKKAADGGLTIDELREFLDEFDKAAAPTPPGVTVTGRNGLKPTARVGFRGGVKSITVTIPGEAGQS